MFTGRGIVQGIVGCCGLGVLDRGIDLIRRGGEC